MKSTPRASSDVSQAPFEGGVEPPSPGSAPALAADVAPGAPRGAARGGPAFDLAAFLPYRLARLSAAVSAELAEVYGARHGLGLAEWRVLAHLSQQEAVSVREIHRRVDLEKPRITRAAQRLAAAGLIHRAEGAGDRRLVALSLTSAGRALMDDLIPLALAAEREALSPLTPQEAETFGRLVDKLLAARDAQ
ncbi:MAG: MarR family winged helix-turn-helix transcriptional regulator [Pseudomonadota bacterium]